jgi:hypothetical protein
MTWLVNQSMILIMLFFQENVVPYIPQAVYKDPYGNSAWSNPIEFQANAGLPNNIFFSDNAYRIVVRQGPNSTDPLIYEVNDYLANSGGGGSGGLDNPLIYAENMITNPQFADVYFNGSLTITTAGTYYIAPGWKLVLEGVGSTVITQNTNSSSPPQNGNPAYYLRMVNTGTWTSVQLVQTFTNNGSIFTLGAIAVAFSAYLSSADDVVVSYAPSTGTAYSFDTFNVLTSQLKEYKAARDIPSSSNTDVGAAAYVDIVFNFPTTGQVNITNVQLVGQSTLLTQDFVNNPTPPSYAQLTYERMVDHEFNVYRDGLVYKPVESYLVGWDFPLNPAQINGRTVAASAYGANKSAYFWDQTIVFQSLNSGISVSSPTNGAFLMTAAVNNTQAAVIQYLEAPIAREILSNKLSVNLNCATNVAVNLTVSLWYTKDASLPDINVGTYNSLVATLDANGKPATFNGTWIEVPKRDNLNNLLSLSPGSYADYGFSYWHLNDPAEAALATFFAIVIGTNELATGTAPGFRSISLVPGETPTIPSPKSYDEVFRQCQYYYEKSYPAGVAPNTSPANGQVTVDIPLVYNIAFNSFSLRRQPFTLNYMTTKRTEPTIQYYLPAAGVAQVRMDINHGTTSVAGANVPITDWTVTGKSKERVSMINNGTNEVATDPIGADPISTGLMTFHYSADARLGIV